MMERDFGVSLPLEVMTFWIIGKPSPKQKYDDVVKDSEGALVSFEQSGWNIFYDEFITRKDKNIPKKINASSGNIEVVLTIDAPIL
jgi:outer membrane biogenesis lipoprotein LolB